MNLIKKNIIKGYATDVIKHEFSNNFEIKKYFLKIEINTIY